MLKGDLWVPDGPQAEEKHNGWGRPYFGEFPAQSTVVEAGGQYYRFREPLSVTQGITRSWHVRHPALAA